MFNRKKIFSGVALTATILVILISTIPPAQAQPRFALASWDYPDAYGQGINKFQIYENSSGSWVETIAEYAYDDSYTIDWDVGVGIKIRCWTWFNCTLTGAATTDIGKNYQKHYVSVVNDLSETMFTQQNFTFGAGYYESYHIYIYAYDVVLNFIPVTGRVYTVTVMYEVFW